MPYCPQCAQEFEPGVDRCTECDVALQAASPPESGEPDVHLVDILVTNNPAEAQVVRALLEANGIICNEHSGVPQNVLPLHVDELEAIRLFVRAPDAESARALIAQRADGGDGD